jgi:hypothetical protein
MYALYVSPFSGPGRRFRKSVVSAGAWTEAGPLRQHRPAVFFSIAFSSEVESGSREESASNQEPRVFHRFREMVKDSSSFFSCKSAQTAYCGLSPA